MPENFEEAYTGLLQAAQADEALQSRIDEALMRIYRVKYKDRADSALGTEGGDTEAAPESEGEDLPEEN